MLSTSPTLSSFVAALVFAASAFSEAAAQSPRVGRVVGHLDGISQDGDHFFISGWACQQGQAKSIAVHLFADVTTNGVAKKTFVLAQPADLYSETAVAQACQDQSGGKHRFVIRLPPGYGPQSTLYVHGIRVVEGVTNDAIAGSGNPLARLASLATPYAILPPLSGAYRGVAEHPRVFTTPAELKDLATRINRPASYSMQRFGSLAEQIKRDLTPGINWDATYAGCDGGIYQYAFSYEPQGDQETKIRAALQIPASAKAPAGAAVVAARLALYAALVQAGATVPPGAPSGDAAAALSKRILLAWAAHGFPRDAHGSFQSIQSLSCGDGIVLALGRGVLYSAHAQDLLQSMGALDAGAQSQLDALHRAMFDLLRQSDNEFYAGVADCARNTNIAANVLASLLATARLLDDGRKLTAALYGGDPSTPVLRPWVRFDRAIYGVADRVPECATHNLGPDSLTSLKNHWDFQTSTVAPGEISDRGRNATPLNGVGYPMFTLERLFDGAEVLRVAGFDPYGYRGLHKQSLEMAMQYYSCFAQSAGFYKIVTAENSRACPNAAQYYGKLVNGVDHMVLIGAYRFPENAKITAVESSARTVAASPGAFSNDAILFGKWRD